MTIALVKSMCAFALCLSIVSCGDNKKQEDPADVAEDHNDAKFEQSKEKDAQFMVDAATINQEEIQLGQLAQSKATAADVKELANMMVTEHTKALEELKGLAAKKGVTLPASLSTDKMDDYNKMMEKSNNDFDKAYSQKMVDGHKDAIKKFEDVANDQDRDAEVRDWANKMLPSLRTHLDHSMMCADKYK